MNQKIPQHTIEWFEKYIPEYTDEERLEAYHNMLDLVRVLEQIEWNHRDEFLTKSPSRSSLEE